jgi:hypothetical protein
MKSSFRSLIPFLLLFCNWKLNSIPLLPSSYPGRLGSRNSTQFFWSELFFITTFHGPRRKHNRSIVGKTSLQRLSIATEVTRLLLAYSLPRECVYLATNIYSDFDVPVFGCHVTIQTNPAPLGSVLRLFLGFMSPPRLFHNSRRSWLRT